MLDITFYGHSAFSCTDGTHTILIDPFITGNPLAPVKANELSADFIVLTHGHGDHLGDAVDIAKRCDATIIAVNELANYVASKGAKAHNMHIGGGYNFPFGRVKFTIAHHGSSTPDGEYMGEPAGVVITMGGKKLYHAGDTGLFLDMKLIGELDVLDCALLPIGDNFTMGIDDAIKAAEFLNPHMTIPMHYNTFGVIEADPREFKQRMGDIGKACIVIEPGRKLNLS